jgi:hypothetical protein
VDGRLAALLNGDRGPDTEAELRAVFGEHPATAMFLDAVLDDAPLFRPPQVVEQQVRAAGHGPQRGTGYGPLAGDRVPPGAERYCCPSGDFEWFRPGVSTPVPVCPTPDHGPLRPC